MSVMRPEWPEQYAPPERRVQEETFSREKLSEQSPSGNLDSLIQRVAGASMDEIDHVIRELESMRESLRREAERVSFDLAAFVSVTHSSMSAMKIITENLKALKKDPRSER